MTLTRRVIALLLPVLALSAGGCFTGVESTPRIKQSDVKEQKAAGTTAEQLFLSDITSQAPHEWQRGKRFLVASDRISLIFGPSSSSTEGLAGTELRFEEFRPSVSLTGDDAGEVVLSASGGRQYFYRVPGLDGTRLDTLSHLDIPFTVDLDVVERIDAAMRGNSYFIRTPLWYNKSRESVQGLRHIEVRIDSVVAGDENFVAAVYFTVVNPELALRAVPDASPRMVFMSTGTRKSSTRNFDTQFSFTDPRKTYPEIKDDVWELITASKVRPGMSRDECRLALGAPHEVLRTPTYGGMRERWSYTDGVYLIFDDGYLSRFRL